MCGVRATKPEQEYRCIAYRIKTMLVSTRYTPTSLFTTRYIVLPIQMSNMLLPQRVSTHLPRKMRCPWNVMRARHRLSLASCVTPFH